MSKYVPYATRKRLPLYYKILKSLNSREVSTITSFELAKLLQIDPTIIRRDFSAIRKVGRKGSGYPVDELIEVFETEFDLNSLEGVIIIGLGDLGSAVAKYYERQDSISYISQIYDVDENKIGKIYNGVEVLDQRDIAKTIDKSSHIAILTVPEEKTQAILDELVVLGITGFINFTGAKVFSDNHEVIIKDIDSMQVVQSLIYDMRMGG